MLSFPFTSNPPIPSTSSSSALDVGVAIEGDPCVGVAGREELREEGMRASEEEGVVLSTRRRSTVVSITSREGEVSKHEM